MLVVTSNFFHVLSKDLPRRHVKPRACMGSGNLYVAFRKALRVTSIDQRPIYQIDLFLFLKYHFAIALKLTGLTKNGWNNSKKNLGLSIR